MNMHKRLSPARFRELFLAHDELPAAEPVDAPHRRVAVRVLVGRPTQRGLRARRARLSRNHSDTPEYWQGSIYCSLPIPTAGLGWASRAEWTYQLAQETP